MTEQEKLVLHGRALAALKDRIAQESYLSVKQVCARLGYSRAIVEALPPELLPFVPYGGGQRIYRRYHPADVLATDARLRAWERAKQRGEGEQYLERLRSELEEMDAAAIATAAEMRRAS